MDFLKTHISSHLLLLEDTLKLGEKVLKQIQAGDIEVVNRESQNRERLISILSYIQEKILKSISLLQK